MNINFNAILAWVGYFLAAYLLIIVFCYLVMLLVALYRIKRNTRYERPMDLLSNNEFYSLGVSVLVPAYNEESGIYPECLLIVEPELQRVRDHCHQ